jgi:hypothetical protein
MIHERSTPSIALSLPARACQRGRRGLPVAPRVRPYWGHSARPPGLKRVAYGPVGGNALKGLLAHEDGRAISIGWSGDVRIQANGRTPRTMDWGASARVAVVGLAMAQLRKPYPVKIPEFPAPEPDLSRIQAAKCSETAEPPWPCLVHK